MNLYLNTLTHYFIIFHIMNKLRTENNNLTIPAVSTEAPAFKRVSTISTLPFLAAQTKAVVPYYKKRTIISFVPS